MDGVNPCGPVVLPPDCETPADALQRSYHFHKENAGTIWMPLEYRDVEAKKALDAAKAQTELETITSFPAKRGDL